MNVSDEWPDWSEWFKSKRRLIRELSVIPKYGKVVQVIGLMIESIGPDAKIGDICMIQLPSGESVKAEVVGFRQSRVLLMPLGALASIRVGSLVVNTGESLKVNVGEGMLGAVLNGLGEPFHQQDWPVQARYPVDTAPPPALNRPRIDKPMATGVRSIDALLTLGQGQRVGIFAGSGVGKSSLLGMIARSTSAQVNVIALIGERGREVTEFIENELGEEGLSRSVVVVATSDQPALMRIKGALTATAIAEYFRDLGLDVLLMMDSVTRFATALREVGLAIGEPPATRGYTPSVFAKLPVLLERAGRNDKGSITAIYTVLVDGDDLSEPIADAVRGILDGHIVLDRRLAEQGQYPAIDVLASVSRVMDKIISSDHAAMAKKFKEVLAVYRRSEDLINIGAYQKGSSAEIDLAVYYHQAMIDFLKQGIDESPNLSTSVERLIQLVKEM